MRERLEETCSRYSIEILYAFGSRSEEVRDLVAGRIRFLASGASDVDLGIKLRPGASLSVRERALLGIELEDLLGADKVDLCEVQEVDSFVAVEVIRGERIYCEDEWRADEYELYVLRRAGDLAPLGREWMGFALGGTSCVTSACPISPPYACCVATALPVRGVVLTDDPGYQCVGHLGEME